MQGLRTSKRAQGCGFRPSPSVPRGPGICLAILFLSALTGLLGPAFGQEDLWVPEIPMTRGLSPSARALGMGGAYLAVSDDATALHYNPAGLARIQRPEFLGSLSDLKRTIDTNFHGEAQENSLPRTRISALGFAYPFPTYRGSMVIALGYMAPWPLDRQYGRRASFDGRTVQEDIFEEGQIGEWSCGYAVDVAPTLAVGFRGSWIHGGRDQDWIYRETGYEDVHEVSNLDLDGFTGALGAMARLRDWGRLGLVVNLPRWISMEGTILDVAGGGEYFVDEEMTLPYSVGVGLSATVPNLLLTADARFTDWTQIDYEGPMRYEQEPGEPGTKRLLAYERTWNLHLGGEYLLDHFGLAGLRLRAGLAWEPVPYRVLLEDVTEEGVPVYRSADYDPNLFSVSAGLGVLLAESLTVDAAFAAGKFERSGVDLAEEQTDRRLLITAAFRLD